MDMLHLAYAFTCQWKLGLLYLAIVNNAAIEHDCTNISLRPCFQFWGVCIQKQILLFHMIILFLLFE